MCMARNTHAFTLKHCIWTVLKSVTMLHYKIQFFSHFCSRNEQKCNTVLWGNMTPRKKYLFLLCYWKMMKGTNKDNIEVLLMQTKKER